MEELQKIYVDVIKQLLSRLQACRGFLKIYKENKNEFYIDSAILQLRKVLELLALASISPNKSAYEKFRMKAESAGDYRKDYKASSIIKTLNKINPDFYPIPLLDSILNKDGIYHFERKTENFLTVDEFIKLYDKLGKYLHADNPWGNTKNLTNFVITLDHSLDKIESLVSLYSTIIRSDTFIGVWILVASIEPIKVDIIVGSADSDFVVKY